MAIFQAGGRRIGSPRHRTGLMGLTEHQLTYIEYAVGDSIFGVIRTFQRQRQAATRRPCTTGARNEAAVQVKAVVGREADTAAIAGHLHPALPRNIQRRLGSGSVQARALAHHHKQIAGLGNAGGQVDVAADADLAAIAHLAIDIAPVADRRDGA